MDQVSCKAAVQCPAEGHAWRLANGTRSLNVGPVLFPFYQRVPRTQPDTRGNCLEMVLAPNRITGNTCHFQLHFHGFKEKAPGQGPPVGVFVTPSCTDGLGRQEHAARISWPRFIPIVFVLPSSLMAGLGYCCPLKHRTRVCAGKLIQLRRSDSIKGKNNETMA